MAVVGEGGLCIYIYMWRGSCVYIYTFGGGVVYIYMWRRVALYIVNIVCLMGSHSLGFWVAVSGKKWIRTLVTST